MIQQQFHASEESSVISEHRTENPTPDYKRETAWRSAAQMGTRGKSAAQMGTRGRSAAQMGTRGRSAAQMGTRGGAGEQVFTLFLLLNMGLSCNGSSLTSKDKLLLHLTRMEYIFSSLWMAEQDYVTYVFGGKPPEKYKAERWELIHGISFSKNSSALLESSCTISQCLDQHLPAIVKTSTQNQQSILGNVTEFQHVFTQALNASQEEPCQRRTFTVTRKGYRKKELGLKILFSTRKWLVYLTNTTQFN